MPQRARHIKRGEARRVLVQRYLDKVVAADRAMVARVFHVLKWTKRKLGRAIETLVEDGAVREAQVKVVKHSQLISNHAMVRGK